MVNAIEPMKTDMELLSNSMATYAHIKANPESFALYFMMGVCVGLLMALCLMVTAIACRTGRRRRRHRPSPGRSQQKEPCEEEQQDHQSIADEEDGDGDVHLPRVLAGPVSARSSQSNGTLRSMDVFTSAEELEKARRLEERERIVREIWRNGQPDILATGTGTIGRVHYH